MKLFKVLPRSKMFEMYNFLQRENRPEIRVIAIREIDLSSLERARRTFAGSTGSEGGRASYTSFIAHATAKVLKEMPHANRSAIDTPFYKRIFQFTNADVSVAVERPDADEHTGGAFLYTIREADKKNVKEISKEIAGLSQSRLEDGDPRLDRWKRMQSAVRFVPFIWLIKTVIWLHRNLPGAYVENRGGAAMISSPSKYGVDFIAAHWPYTLGISFGLAKDRPWAVNGEVVVRKTMFMTLAFDRRIIPGADGARFMNRLCELLETAETTLIDVVAPSTNPRPPVDYN